LDSAEGGRPGEEDEVVEVRGGGRGVRKVKLNFRRRRLGGAKEEGERRGAGKRE